MKRRVKEENRFASFKTSSWIPFTEDVPKREDVEVKNETKTESEIIVQTKIGRNKSSEGNEKRSLVFKTRKKRNSRKLLFGHLLGFLWGKKRERKREREREEEKEEERERKKTETRTRI